jgi:hypothetical protein
VGGTRVVCHGRIVPHMQLDCSPNFVVGDRH